MSLSTKVGQQSDLDENHSEQGASFGGDTFGGSPAAGVLFAFPPLTAAGASVAVTGQAFTAAAPYQVAAVGAVKNTPSWVSGLSNASIASDMASAINTSNQVTYSGLSTLLNDVKSTLSNATLSASQLADLQTIVANLGNGVTTSAYLTGIMNSLVNGDAMNATWTGGGASSTSLGNLAAGASQAQLSDLIGKWFQGTDLPSSSVSMDGNFSVSYSTSSSPLFGASGPSWSDVNQGYLGDCYLLSSLAEVAYKNSSVISSMFTDNGNGTYGVRFYIDGAAEYVTVNSSLANGGSKFNHGSDIWASLAEKAFAQLQAGGDYTGNGGAYSNSWTTIGNGGMPEYALAEITGATQITDYSASGSSWSTDVYNASQSITNWASGASTATVQSTLIADLNAGDDVILSSWTDAKDSSGKTTLVSSHAMSIYGYDSATGLFEVRNPWGGASGSNQSWLTTFEVSLSTLLAAGDTITVDNIGGSSTQNTAPNLTSQTAAQTWTPGQAVSFKLASNTFTDAQGQTLTYTATKADGSALPSWLTFNAATETFSGTVPASGADGLSIKVTATDTGGLSTSETFSVQIVTGGGAPTVTSQTTTQIFTPGKAVNFSLAKNTFTDPQGETLTYKATLANGSALPSWLTFNATTGTFGGTAPNSSDPLSIKITATDTSGLSTSETFQIMVDKAPKLTSQTSTQSWKPGQTVSFSLASNTFTDPEGQTLTYKATQSNGSALPSWLTFDATTGTFSGVVPNTAAAFSIKVTATDPEGLAASETFNVQIPYAAPKVTSQTATQTWMGGSAVSLALPSNTFTDPQSETLTYKATLANGSALPSWLAFNAATQTFSGTAPSDGAQSLSIKVTATDTSGLSTSETFGVKISSPAPQVASQTKSQTWTASQAFSLALNSNTFKDPQGQSLTYTATLANGSALPSWLTFNAATETFSGTAPDASSSLSIKVTATDTSGCSGSETFQVNVKNTAPKLTSATAAQTWTVGQAVSFQLGATTFTDAEGQKLTYKAALSNGSALPSWLTFNADSGAFTGTVPAAADSLSIKVTATDSGGLSTSETFKVTVPNTAPKVTSATATQSWTEGQAVSLKLAAKTFTDAEGQKLSYSATQSNGSALPSWLSFNSNTLTFSGTAPNAASSLTIKVTATDTGQLSSSETFGVTVAAATSKLTHAIAGANNAPLPAIASLVKPVNSQAHPVFGPVS